MTTKKREAQLLALGMSELPDSCRDAKTQTVIYYDDATSKRWRVSESAVVELGRRVEAQQALHPSDRGELYSLWCAETSAEEIS